MTLDSLFDRLWLDYSAMNKQAEVIHAALEKRGETVVNDHVAFRTFDLPKVNIEVMAQPFLKLGYRPHKELYRFEQKKLIARHFEHPDSSQPKVFISALQVEKLSNYSQEVIGDLVEQVPACLPGQADFLVSGIAWKPLSSKVYHDLLKESEYAAWMSAFGFRVNHFTVFFNALKTFKTFPELNQFVKETGFPLNASGGEIKGSPQVFLEQSSTLAYPVKVKFSDKEEVIPGCYYEFARRYALPAGGLFQGFLPESADKIFDSTNFRAK